MAVRSGANLSSWLWAVAFSALALSALAAPADEGGVRNLALGGGVLWGTAFILDPDGRRARRRGEPRATGLVVGVLVVAGLAEALAMASALGEGQDPQALWFGSGVGFAAAGVASTLRRGPSDPALACQLFLHVLVLFPAAAIVLVALLRAIVGGAGAGAVTGASPLTKSLILVVTIALPLLCTSLLATLGYQLTRPTEERSLPWTALLVLQAAFAALAARWAYDGL